MKGIRRPWAAALALSVSAVFCNYLFSGQSHAATDQDSLVLVGPLEAFDSEKGIATILGQHVMAGQLAQAEIGTVVAVFGHIRSDSSIVASDLQFGGLYVPGASPVLLTGVVSVNKSAIGRITVGDVNVDYNAVNNTDLKQGSVVQLIGTQPALAGVVLAEQIAVAKTTGIIGGGFKLDGIIGGGLKLNGIIGGGKAAIDGIIGGGKAPVDGIIGGGKAAATGIIGGGKASAAGIIGGGKAPISGIIGGG